MLKRHNCVIIYLFQVTDRGFQLVSCGWEFLAPAHTYGDIHCRGGSMWSLVLPENVSSCHISLHPLRDYHTTQQQADFLWSRLFLGWAMFRGLQRGVTWEDFWARHRNGGLNCCCSSSVLHTLVSVLLGLARNQSVVTLYSTWWLASPQKSRTSVVCCFVFGLQRCQTRFLVENFT